MTVSDTRSAPPCSATLGPPGPPGPGRPRSGSHHDRHREEVSAANRQAAETLRTVAGLTADEALAWSRSSPDGLTEVMAQDRLDERGPNEVAHDRPPHPLVQLGTAFKNPFVLVLVGLNLVLTLTDGLGILGGADAGGDWTGTITLSSMVLISVAIRFWQEFRSTSAAERLKAMITTTTTVVRRTDGGPGVAREIPLAEVVPGDIIQLAAGDLVPADLRLLSSKELHLGQAVLTGESLPVEKYDTLSDVVEKSASSSGDVADDVLDAANLCFMGTSVTSGSATALVVATGSDTYFGSMAKGLVGVRPETSFDRGIRSVSYLLIRFMVVMVPVVFILNGATKGDWGAAFYFSVAVAVGLTPEMLPVIVTANLARGAVQMAKRKVIVKHLNAIQSFGSMTILCTDKTGTLTEDRIVLEHHLDTLGQPSDEVLRLAYLNSVHQSGLRNLLDRAVIDHVEQLDTPFAVDRFHKVDEIPFDFVRRRLSVVVDDGAQHLLVTKGAVDEMLDVCTHVVDQDGTATLTDDRRVQLTQLVAELNRQGLRVLAVASRPLPPTTGERSAEIERGLTLAGFVAFLDPPKVSAGPAIVALEDYGVAVKVITGDAAVVAAEVCAQVGLDIGERIVLGTEIDALSDDELTELALATTLFAKVHPLQKARIVRCLQAAGNTVGYLGDGINDAAALRDADVGISVDSAVDIAKESADIILLEKDLLVLEQGVIEGRRTFGNIMKYLKMTASSNFGNVFSILIASAFLPFEPMLAVMLLAQNLLYDVSQLSIPWDTMDDDYMRTPHEWAAGDLGRFMVTIGPISSVFDIVTFVVMWFVFKANTPDLAPLFQSGWFIEGLLSQTLIVHMIRTRRIPFIQSRATAPVLILTAAIMAVGIWLPFSPIGSVIGLVPLPLSYFPWLVGILVGYSVMTQLLKTLYIKRFGTWL